MVKNKINVLIAEDHKIVLDSFKNTLSALESIGEIYEAENGIELLKQYFRYRPDLLLVDINLPDLNGIDAVAEIREKDSKVKIILITSHEEPYLVEQALRVGVNGYLLKSKESLEKFTEHVEKIINGAEIIFGEGVKAKLKEANEVGLTEREIEIVKFIIEGYSSREISNLLDISIFTVNNHRKSIKRKTRCDKPANLYDFAIRNNILPKF